MQVDIYDADNRAYQEKRKKTVRPETQPDVARSIKSDDFWQLGSREGNVLDSYFLERQQHRQLGDLEFEGFDTLVRTFFAENFSEDPVRGDQNIKVSSQHCGL
jgi:hypothetical protein